MTTPVDKIVGSWTAYLPLDAGGVTYTSAGNEKRINWGTPKNPSNAKAALGYTPASPPSQDVEVGADFKLGELKFYNFDTGFPTTTPPPGTTTTSTAPPLVEKEVTKATLHVQIKADFYTTDFNISFNITGNSIAFSQTVPITLGASNFTLKIRGFAPLAGGTPVQSFSVALNGTDQYNIIAQLVTSPLQEDQCKPGEFTPVFDPPCPIDPICPISEDPIIEDCYIPDAPLPLTDCPDIDIPVGVVTPIDGASGLPMPIEGPPGPQGPAGPMGPPGPPGEGGCTPQIQVINQEIKGHGPSCYPHIETQVIPVGACSVIILIKNYTCPPSGPGGMACCVWVCCNGEWQLTSGSEDASQPGYCSPGYLPDGPLCNSQGSQYVYCPCETTTPGPTTTPAPTTSSTYAPTSSTSSTYAPTSSSSSSSSTQPQGSSSSSSSSSTQGQGGSSSTPNLDVLRMAPMPLMKEIMKK